MTFILQKTSDGFRQTISDFILVGTGVGMPQGILNPSSGVSICDTAATTPVDQISWQDLVMLKFRLPASLHPNAVYVMNQNTYALILTLTDAAGRPIMIPSPVDPHHQRITRGVEFENA